MDPLSYNKYNYDVSNHQYSYNVKVEPLLHPRVEHDHPTTTDVPIPMQNIPNPMQQYPNPIQDVPNPIHNVPSSIHPILNSITNNSIENISNVMLDQSSIVQNLQLPLSMQNTENIPQSNGDNTLGMYGNENRGEVGSEAPVVNADADMVEDSKEDLKPLLAKAKARRRKKPRGKVSNYWNKKITDANFPFYGCSICNISFTGLHELDQHVPIHKGRLTSYDLRLKNKRKRKLLKKENKKMKKLGKKLKKECMTTTDTFVMEIKPEDGYIGNEKAAEYTENVSNYDTSNLNEQNGLINGDTDEKEDKVGKGDTKEFAGKDEQLGKDDPRLEKLFKCFACQKQFSLGYYLKLHVRSHTDEKPYTCAQCGQSFITASKLGRHNKRIHLAIRYQCRICYRLFTRFEYLVRHFDKKHADQKLDGEPYDFNAILPYLNELEEQLMHKVEAKDVKEPKPETQDWGDVKQDVPQTQTQTWGEVKQDDTKGWRHEIKVIKQDESSQESQPLDVFLQPTMNIVVDEVEKVEIEIKKEKQDVDEEPLKEESFHDDDDEDDNKDKVNFKDESVSDDDEDYFPSNTWAAPAPAADPPEPEPRPRRLRRKDFPLQCELCDKKISTLTYMKVHLRTHTGEKPFKCYVCGRGFITSSKMHRHVLTHGTVPAPAEEETLEAGDVKDDPDKADDADGAVAGEGKRKGKSSKKKKKGVQTVKAKKHQPRPRPHACSFCNKRFLHVDTLRVHQKSHEGETRVLKCNFCLEEQPDEETLKTHEAAHAGPRPYLCTVCSRTYTKKESMIYHKKSHSSESARKTFVCDICSKGFSEQCKLQRHIVSHRTDKFTLRYECPVCAHMFHTRYHVEMHLATHLKEGTISEHNRSEILAMVLQNARKIPKPGILLDAPLPEITPSDERSTVCNICGELFPHFYFLEEHLKSHGSKIAIEDLHKEEEVKKHVCPVCNKGFKLPYYLKLHSFTHTKEKPFICQQCGKGFITKGKLKRHLESHTGLKKYQCHICYKFFTRPSYQRIHVRTIHGTQDYNFRLDSFVELCNPEAWRGGGGGGGGGAVARSPSHESVTTDLSLFSVSSAASDARILRLLASKAGQGPEPALRVASPNPDAKTFNRRSSALPLGGGAGGAGGAGDACRELLAGCAALCAQLGVRRSFSAGDVLAAETSTDTLRSASSEMGLCAALEALALSAPSRCCSTWVAVGGSQLPSPQRAAPPAPPAPPPRAPPLDNRKVRQSYIKRRLLTTYRALERMSQSEFNLNKLEAAAAAAAAPGPTTLAVPPRARCVHPEAARLALTAADLERERGRPLSKYERNMIIFNWLHTLDEPAPAPAPF